MKLALRIDDIGASSKRFEIYSKIRGCNILFLKYLPGLRSAGPYREMTADEWMRVFELLNQFNAKLTVGITATWVEKDNTLVPFHEKFLSEAEALKKGHEAGLLEIANHGLTHCVVGKHRTRLFSSNRTFHREFWEWLPANVHFEHMQQSQEILQGFFQTPITTFIPPGNVFTDTTLQAAKKYGINLVNCHTQSNVAQGVRIINNKRVIAFHDRELVMEGELWLDRILSRYSDRDFCFVRDL